MKKHALFPFAVTLGSVIAFVLRFLQNQTGFEEVTGLPIAGNVPGLVLAGWLIMMAGFFFVLARKHFSDEPSGTFPAAFTTANSTLLFLPVAGLALFAVSGLVDLYEGLTQNRVLFQLQAAADPYSAFGADAFSGGFASVSQILLGAVSLLVALSLFPAVSACRKDGKFSGRVAFDGVFLLIAPVALVVRLVLTYRLDSINPSLEAYYMELLALVFLTLAFYRLSSFAFSAASLSRFAIYTGLAAVCSLAALADGGPYLSSLLLYLGGPLTLMGFLLLRIVHADDESAPISESSE